MREKGFHTWAELRMISNHLIACFVLKCARCEKIHKLPIRDEKGTRVKLEGTPIRDPFSHEGRLKGEGWVSVDHAPICPECATDQDRAFVYKKDY